ncbi:hypothetical protein Btru_058468 [Bulinus truncatus]|nr:hypothetical protein Btru_058468 [Bulinus truncatus]
MFRQWINETEGKSISVETYNRKVLQVLLPGDIAKVSWHTVLYIGLTDEHKKILGVYAEADGLITKDKLMDLGKNKKFYKDNRRTDISFESRLLLANILFSIILKGLIENESGNILILQPFFWAKLGTGKVPLEILYLVEIRFTVLQIVFPLQQTYGTRLTKEEIYAFDIMKRSFGDLFTKFCYVVVTYGEEFDYDNKDMSIEDWFEKQDLLKTHFASEERKKISIEQKMPQLQPIIQQRMSLIQEKIEKVTDKAEHMDDKELLDIEHEIENLLGFLHNEDCKTGVMSKFIKQVKGLKPMAKRLLKNKINGRKMLQYMNMLRNPPSKVNLTISRVAAYGTILLSGLAFTIAPISAFITIPLAAASLGATEYVATLHQNYYKKLAALRLEIDPEQTDDSDTKDE